MFEEPRARGYRGVIADDSDLACLDLYSYVHLAQPGRAAAWCAFCLALWVHAS